MFFKWPPEKKEDTFNTRRRTQTVPIFSGVGTKMFTAQKKELENASNHYKVGPFTS